MLSRSTSKILNSGILLPQPHKEWVTGAGLLNGHTSLPFSSRPAIAGGAQSKHIIKRYIISHEVMVTAYTNDKLARDKDLSDL